MKRPLFVQFFLSKFVLFDGRAAFFVSEYIHNPPKSGRLFCNTIIFSFDKEVITLYEFFFTSAIDTLQILVVALGAGLGAWGVINLLEGYGNDNPGAKSQGMKQLMAGGGIAVVGMTLIPLLSGLF